MDRRAPEASSLSEWSLLRKKLFSAEFCGIYILIVLSMPVTKTVILVLIM